MAVTIKAYGNFPLNLLKYAFHDLSASGTVLKFALVTSTYAFNQGSHTTFNDITNEITGAGYTTGGVTATNKAVTYSARVSTFDCDDPQWPSSTITMRGSPFYDATTAGATNQKLICFIDFGQDYSTSTSTFQLALNTSGLFIITVPA